MALGPTAAEILVGRKAESPMEVATATGTLTAKAAPMEAEREKANRGNRRSVPRLRRRHPADESWRRGDCQPVWALSWVESAAAAGERSRQSVRAPPSQQRWRSVRAGARARPRKCAP